jgi:hypothetical protein
MFTHPARPWLLLALQGASCRASLVQDASGTTAPVDAGEPSRLRDPEDGAFDVSGFLESAHGFLPIVMPSTEPAVGYGAALAALSLDPRESAGEEGCARPNLTADGGMATEYGSSRGFAINSTIWGEGRLQALAGGGQRAARPRARPARDRRRPDPGIGPDRLGARRDLPRRRGPCAAG